MPCACKVNQSIAQLQREFGVKQKVSKESHIRDMVKILPKKILIGCAVVLMFPIMLTAVLGNTLFNHNKPMNVGKFFKIGNARG